jgi:hypothetical protein
MKQGFPSEIIDRGLDFVGELTGFLKDHPDLGVQEMAIAFGAVVLMIYEKAPAGVRLGLRHAFESAIRTMDAIDQGGTT